MPGLLKCSRSDQGVIKGPGGTSFPPAHSDDSHQPLTQSWNTISSWTSPNQWEIYQIKPHFDQIGTVNVSQRLWSVTAVVFGFWKNQARGWRESSEWAGVELVSPILSIRHPSTDILNQMKIYFQTEKNTSTCVKILKRVIFYHKIYIVKYV